jgi:uncharacterized membrane protein YgaE (UPF0421/DUF939 family)
MKIIGYRTIKTAIGATAAIFISRKLGLEYPISAAIITILSIQNTRKQSVNVAFQRLGAGILALALATILFRVIGFNEITFGIFLLIFIPLSVRLKVEEGIVVSAVIVIRLLGEESTSFLWWKNEMSLMFVGVSVALILNFFMPSLEAQIMKDQIYIRKKIKEILILMSKSLRDSRNAIDDEVFTDLEERLFKARKLALINYGNYFFTDVSYYVRYMEMRQKQFETLKRMRDHLRRFFITYVQMEMIADFTERTANFITEEDTAEITLHKLNLLRDNIRKMPLPSTREEFENRAILFMFINELEEFNLIKNEFKKDFEE